jgi:hypothetical protein
VSGSIKRVGKRSLGALFLALVPFGAVATAPTTAALPEAPSSSALPPQLVALEQKMEALQVNSERFSGLERVSTFTDEVEGRRLRHYAHRSATTTMQGEASLVPAEGEVELRGKETTLRQIVVGSTVYQYEASRSQRRRARPWVRFHSSKAELLPFHEDPSEVGGGGTGPYAGLIDLLATATGPVETVAGVSVDGQLTSEFLATVQAPGLANGQGEQELRVFITESGLPIRVSTTSRSLASITVLATIDILAVNIPVSVKAPPARETIPAAAVHGDEGTSSSSSLGRARQK